MTSTYGSAIQSTANRTPSAAAAPTAPDLGAIKERQQATWASGDYHMIGTQIVIVSELLIEALDLHSTDTWREAFAELDAMRVNAETLSAA